MDALSPSSTITAKPGTDGVFVIRNGARTLQAADTDLRCVDLIDNPYLETLDLSACATPVHLTVRGCPKLATVLLPDAPEGAVLHWEFGEADSPVQVVGALASFDSCQSDGHTCQIQANGALYDRSLLVPAGAPQPTLADETALVILLGTAEGGLQSAPLVTPKLRAVHLHSVGTADELDLNGPALNRLEDQAVATTMSSALSNRFCHLDMAPDTSSWLGWGRKVGLHPTVLGFLAWRPDLLFKMDRDSQRGWASPRSWERVSYILKLFDTAGSAQPEDLLALQVAGLIGDAAATEFLAFRHIALEGPSAEDILLRGQAPVVPRQGDRRFALASALIHVALTHRRRQKSILLRLLTVTEAFGADFAAMIVNAVTDVMSVPELEALMATPEMASWRKRHGVAIGRYSKPARSAPAASTSEDMFDLDTLIKGAQ